MLNFKEELLQFIWQYQLLKPIPLITKSGIQIFILKTGELNTDSGPDFFNAQIRINNLILSGNIEIHIKTSDWLKHNHQKDKSYNTLILHVVYEYDVEILQNLTNNVEILELKNYISKQTIEKYKKLSINRDKLPCKNLLKDSDNLIFKAWVSKMLLKRLEEKTNKINLIFESCHGNFTQTFYSLLLKNFGFKVNATPFELISNNLPVHLLLKHSDNLIQLEALLLGIAGLLEKKIEDEYMKILKIEFSFLKKKYKLIPLKGEIFKFSKLRPANFPNYRLVQFAKIIHTNPFFILSPQEFTTYEKINKTLKINLTGYWKNHYKIDGNLLDKNISFGKKSIEGIIINSIAPFFLFYYKKSANPKFKEIAHQLLNTCKFEINSKTSLFLVKKNILKTADSSQALIYLFDNYCIKKLCLKCDIAAAYLKSK